MSSRSLGQLTLDLVAKVGGFEAGLNQAARKAKSVSKEIESSAQLANKAWKILGGVIGAIGAGGVITKVMDNTKQLELQQAQLAAVLRSTGEAAGFSRDELNAMGAALSSASMFSTGEITEAQTTLLAFTGIVGGQFPKALQAAADMAARTGMSIKAAAETIGRALDVPSKGLGSLSDQGFRFTEEQKKLAKQLEATGRVAEAQAIILDALEESYAGAAQAARNTFAGALSALQGTLSDLMTGGDGSLSAATAAINALNDALSTPEARKAVELLSDAAVVLAAVLGGKLAGSAASSAMAFAGAQIQAARYQATLARMAGVSQVAAVSMVSMSAAARAASGALALMGGPAGAFVAAASAISYFALRTSDAEKQAKALDARISQLDSTFKSMTANQAASALLDYQAKLAQAEKEAGAAAATVSRLNHSIQFTPRSPHIKEWERDLIKAKGTLDTKTQAVEELRKKIEELNQIINRPTSTVAGSGIDPSAAKEIERQIKALEEQAEVAGMAADAAALYRLQQLGAKDSDLQRAEAAMKVVAAYEEQTKAIERQQKANADATALIESLRTEEEQIRASYDRRREIILASSIHTAEEKNDALIRLEQEKNDRLKELDEKLAEERLEANGSFWEKWLDAAEDGLFSMDELAGSVLDNFSSRFGDAFEEVVTASSSAEDAFKNLADGMIRSVINATGQMLAQWAVYELARMALSKPAQAGAVLAMTANAEAASTMAGLNSYASTAAIPIVGPALAPGAAAAAVAATQPMVATVTAAASAGLAGMAHDGMDYIPREGTWLLDEGERVVDRRTNADLKSFLAKASGAADRQINPAWANSPSMVGFTQPALPPITIQINIEGNADEDTIEQMQLSGREIIAMVENHIMRDARTNGPIRRALGR